MPSSFNPLANKAFASLFSSTNFFIGSSPTNSLKSFPPNCSDGGAHP